LKAAAFDKLIKKEIAAKSDKQMSKIARLKALRLAPETPDISKKRKSRSANNSK